VSLLYAAEWAKKGDDRQFVAAKFLGRRSQRTQVHATTFSALAFFARVSAQAYGITIRHEQFPKPAIEDASRLRPSARPERSKIMPLIQLLEVLIVVGVLLWLVNRFIPMQSSIKSILNGVVVIAVVLWLLNVFGLFHSISSIHVGKG
jgi:hypothetical protein